MERFLHPELLDALPASDPDARHSRADLQRVNSWMGNADFLARAVIAVPLPIRRIVEIGAGDGTLLLNVATRLRGRFNNMEAVLMDRQGLVAGETLDRFRQLGWNASVTLADLFDWLGSDGPRPGDLVLANLFLHHFDEARLRALFDSLSKTVHCVIACEPRRSGLSLASTRLLRVIGCNHVTRHDAAVSVVAGFRGDELSRLWPADATWKLFEKRAGWFSHLFHASRKETDATA